MRKNGFDLGTFTIGLPQGQSATIGNFLSATGVTISVNNFSIDFAAGTVSGTITLTIGSLNLFPSGNFVQSNFGNITASYAFTSATDTGTLKITIGTFQIKMGEAIKLDASNVAITPGQTTLATIGNATLSSPLFQNLATATVTNLVITQSGFTIASASLTVQQGAVPVIGNYIGFGSVTVTVSNFQLVYGPTSTSTSGTVSVHATDVVLFPNISFINKNLGTLDGSYHFSSPGVLNFSVPSFDLPIGEALNIHGDTVTFSPGQDVMMTIGTATVSSPGFSSFGTATISGLQIKKTGLSLANLTLTPLDPTKPIAFGNFITMSGVTLSANNFTIDTSAANKISGSISLNVASLDFHGTLIA